MKNNNYCKLLFSYTLLLSMAVTLPACCNAGEEPIQPAVSPNGDSCIQTVDFTVNIPSDYTRADSFAFGTGAQITSLRYAVYQTDNFYKNPIDIIWNQLDECLFCTDDGAPEVTREGLTFKVSLPLKTHYKTQVVFWADATGQDDLYTLDYRAKTISFDPMSLYAHTPDDKADAFAAVWTHSGDFAQKKVSVTLTRPFLQINVVSNETMQDLEDIAGSDPKPIVIGYKPASSGNVYLPKSLNFKSLASGQFTTTMERHYWDDFKNIETSIPDKTCTLEGKIYKYQGVQYLVPPSSFESYPEISKSIVVCLYGNDRNPKTIEIPDADKYGPNTRLIVYPTGEYLWKKDASWSLYANPYTDMNCWGFIL